MRWAWRAPGHDPERDAAAYLADDQSRRARQRFEAHLLSCEECWSDLALARLGRDVAERAREIAPASLREDVRASVTLLSRSTEKESLPRRLQILVPVLAVLLAGILGGGALLWTGAHRQPEPIASALSSYRSNEVPVAPVIGPAPDLGSAGLRLAGAGHGEMGGMPIDVFAYRGPGHGRVFLYVSSEVFPEAKGASGSPGMARGWTAWDKGLFMLCQAHPLSYLLVGADQGMVGRAERALAAEGHTFALARSA